MGRSECHAAAASLAACDHASHPSSVRHLQALGLPTPLLSTSSFLGAQQQGGDGAELNDDALEEVLTSAAATLGERLLADGFAIRRQPPPLPPPRPLVVGEAAAAVGPVPPSPPPSPPAPPASWQLRCAVVNNLVFHIDVMAGWTYAFQVRARLPRGPAHNVLLLLRCLRILQAATQRACSALWRSTLSRSTCPTPRSLPAATSPSTRTSAAWASRCGGDLA